MKRTLPLLALLFLAGPGCVNFPFTQPPPAPVKPTPTAPPTVLPEEVTADNAHEKLVALSREVDYDAAGYTSQPSEVPAPKR